MDNLRVVYFEESNGTGKTVTKTLTTEDFLLFGNCNSIKIYESNNTIMFQSNVDLIANICFYFGINPVQVITVEIII